MASPPTDQCIVLPFRTGNREPFDGTGLALHFLFGNVLVLHTGLKEMWFGWRVKKIFPEKAPLQRYCRDGDFALDLEAVSRSQKVRFWLYGGYEHHSVRVRWFDGETPTVLPPTEELNISLADDLIGLRTQFIGWLSTVGRSMPEEQVEPALWPEKITPRGLDAVGKALERFYIYSAYEGADPLDLLPFKEAVTAAPESFMAQDLYGWALYRNQDYGAARRAFLTALGINPAGAGAMSGLMWCGVYGKDLEEAMFWSGRKADVCRQDVQTAREAGKRRYDKVNK